MAKQTTNMTKIQGPRNRGDRKRFKGFRTRSLQAFSLVEVLVGTVVAGMTVVAVYLGLASGFQTMRATREDLRATQILIERLEAIRGCNWTTLVNSPPPDFEVSQFPDTGTGAGGVTYSGEVVLGSAGNLVNFTNTPTYVSDQT